ncbi:hypothetical protein AB0B79_07005 [Streptomyces sp. NPDC039022]|uniref:hypothetical protein n=1 Tax=Streptomyces sp. NPDC039022 TaxID=3157091 RepID=UPI0033E36478
MYDYSEVTGEVLNERNALAVRALRELELAGFTAFLQDGAGGPPGAEVEVDLGDDAAGGVYVTWKTHPTLTRTALEKVQSGQLQAREIRHSGAVGRYMQDAMIHILASAGLQAEAAEDDMRPTAVRVREVADEDQGAS